MPIKNIARKEKSHPMYTLGISDKIANLVLAAGVSKTVAIPEDAISAIFTSTGDFWVDVRDTAAVVPIGDELTDGLLYNPVAREVVELLELDTPITDLHLISADGCIVTIEWCGA